MLSISALGMASYGLYSIVVGTADLLGGDTLEWWANVWLMLSGTTLLLAAVFVRGSTPGGLALAVSALLGLQSISLHNDPHAYGQLLLVPQVARALFGAALIFFAYLGWDSDSGPEHDQSSVRG